MSLFGDDDSVRAAVPVSKSLFDDEPSSTPGSKSSLFADDDTGPSPWGLPTPKKAGRQDLIKNLLPASDVPDSYIDVFDNILKDGDGSGGKINADGVMRVFKAGHISDSDQTRILDIVGPNGQRDLGRNEFNVLLALVGLLQEKEDATLDGVDERRKSSLIIVYEDC